MDKKITYGMLKMKDGWHVRKRTEHLRPIHFDDLATCDTRAEAVEMIERITGRKYEQSPKSD